MADTIVARGVVRSKSPKDAASPPQSYKPDRLRRAIRIIQRGGIERCGPTQFRVLGEDEPEYAVDLASDQKCYCKDWQYRPMDNQHPCKHQIAARLLNGDVGLLIAMGELLPDEEL